MSTTESDPITDVIDNEVTASIDADIEQARSGRWQSARGKFKIFRAPPIKRRRPLPDDYDASKIVDGFDYRHMLEDDDEADVREAIGDMAKALNAGITETLLFAQGGPDGMSLAHVWFGANLPLFRHSHPRFGDCLYYVLKGEAHLGSQVLGPGDGFFVPNGMPYKYTAGPDGVEILEYRAGGGAEGAPGMIMNEPNVEAIRRLTETANVHKDAWVDASPERVGESGPTG